MQTSENTNATTEGDNSFLDFLNTSDTDNDELKDVEKEVKETQEDDTANDEASSLTLSITNVVVMASMKCHLRLKEIARTSVDVEYKALQNHVIMRLRSPYTVATIWSSGKIWCTGANSLVKAKVGARRIARRIAKCGFPCHFSKYRVVNIMATCRLPFGVRLADLVRERPMQMSYEPELSPGLTFKIDPNSSTSLKLFSTGRIVIMGSSLDAIGSLVEELVPIAALHQTDEPIPDAEDIPDNDETRAALKAARYMNMMPDDGFGGLAYHVDEEYGNSDGSDGFEYVVRNGFSTDDSTDSGASIDSGGVSTKPKRYVKRRIRIPDSTSSFSKLRGYNSMQSGPPLHLMTPREAASLAYAKRIAGDVEGARGIVAAAGELRRHHELLQSSGRNIVSNNVQREARSNFPQNDPTWCRKAVASGSTKRACVVTYSGTEDSETQDTGSNPELHNQVFLQPTVSLLEQHQQQLLQQAQISQQQQVKFIHTPSMISSLNPPNTVPVSTVITPMNTVSNSLQYVYIKPSTSLGQTVYNNNVLPTAQPTMHFSTTPQSITPMQTNSPLMRLSMPTSVGIVNGQNLQTTVTSSSLSSSSPAAAAATVYPVRLSQNTPTNVISQNDGKVSLKYMKCLTNNNAVIIKLQ
ncbi:unnamed protein product [Trichobilharzia szidati]|nr:unnamed protein product [Trichobilharzia szidati]